MAEDWTNDPEKLRLERDHYREAYFALQARMGELESESSEMRIQLAELNHPLEKRGDGKMVSRDRWESGIRNIAAIFGLDKGNGFEVGEIVDRVRELVEGKSASNQKSPKR